MGVVITGFNYFVDGEPKRVRQAVTINLFHCHMRCLPYLALLFLLL
jgi:hypothetical protein